MPIPFTAEAVHYVAARIRHVQDVLNAASAWKNVSTYAAPAGEMSELEFLDAVVNEADCGFHLDINNIFVNSINHGSMRTTTWHVSRPTGSCMHIAGHYREEDDLRVDTHGEDVLPEVWGPAGRGLCAIRRVPTLLERDFNIPPFERTAQRGRPDRAVPGPVAGVNSGARRLNHHSRIFSSNSWRSPRTSAIRSPIRCPRAFRRAAWRSIPRSSSTTSTS